MKSNRGKLKLGFNIERFKRQEDVNTRKFSNMMEDIRRDVVRRTQNVKDINNWMKRLGIYTKTNILIHGKYAPRTRNIVEGIVNTVDMIKMPPGSNPEIMKGVMAESTMNYVTKLGEDMRLELKKSMVECYNKKLAPKDRAKVMSEKVTSLNKSRAQVIARTETMRAANLAHLIKARDVGAKSYTVMCSPKACPICLNFYGDGDTIFDIDDTEHYPPLHPNCRCSADFSTLSPTDYSDLQGEFEK